MSYPRGYYSTLHNSRNRVGTWLHRRDGHWRRDAIDQFPNGASEQTLREIAQMDQEMVAKLVARRSEQRSPARRPSQHLVGRSA
ncbi:hypothetical protein FV228_15820 [Methylobacterium sp. WL18]|uniref:hypothetical protein n=1 Tax=Methylobacterium sp. WL18 TaxID=2603897 RepID=UPI0011CAA66D|nr:hypothetical protein [Methylobacterium sp. WL18]TXN65374.1 hypothetical protein FV228_15820 [Methylobacterium sp. WL18]